MVQEICSWDVLVFPDGRRSYRYNQDVARMPVDVQVHAVGSPDYATEVQLMREQVREWHARFKTIDLGEIIDGADHDGEDGFR